MSGGTSLAMRELLFGDIAPDRWPERDDLTEEPWRSFIEARRALGAGDRGAAIARLRTVLEQPDLDSRQVLQAWHALRLAGSPPPAELAKRVEGVVVEVGLEGGLDLLAAYRDLSARYVSFSGAAIIWEHPDRSLDGDIETLLSAGRRVVAAIGPWERPRPRPPGMGEVRINFLTPSGLHFGQGPYQNLASDGLGGPVLAAAIRLMQALIGKAGPGQPPR
ncbi:MAG: hypothetical protein EHM78_04200 [Myxococcaceae bacterium]|nr:MAG: hypothetical protein EHM78_04200 [Myxococcaceae bacterium]